MLAFLPLPCRKKTHEDSTVDEWVGKSQEKTDSQRSRCSCGDLVVGHDGEGQAGWKR